MNKLQDNVKIYIEWLFPTYILIKSTLHDW